jgi:hypothetical protein
MCFDIPDFDAASCSQNINLPFPEFNDLKAFLTKYVNKIPGEKFLKAKSKKKWLTILARY